MVKFPLVLLLFEVLVGGPEGGGCYPTKDVPYTGIHTDWRSDGGGGNGYNRNIVDNSRHPNDDRHHIVQPSNCTSNYMDIFNQYMDQRRFHEFPQFPGPPPYPVPQPPFPPYAPQGSSFMPPNLQHPPHFPMYQNKPPEPKQEQPPQQQPNRNQPPHGEKKTDINHAPSPYNMNFIGTTPDLNFRGPPSPDATIPPSIYPGPLGSSLAIPQRPPLPPIGNTQLPFRNEPLQPKESFDMFSIPSMGMMERPGLMDMMEPVPPRFMPKRHIPRDFDDYEPHPLFKRDDISESVSSTSHAEEKTNPSLSSNQALTVSSSSENQSGLSGNQNEENSKGNSKHSPKDGKSKYNDVIIPSKGIQFVTSSPHDQYPKYQNPTLPLSVQNDPMAQSAMQPPYDVLQTTHNNKQLVLFQELLRKLQGGFTNSLLSHGQIQNSPDFSHPNVTPQKNQETALQTKTTSESNPEVTTEGKPDQNSNRPEREKPINSPSNPPIVSQLPPVRQHDYFRSIMPPFSKVTEQNVASNFDIDPRKYFSGPNYVDPSLNETPDKCPFIKPYEPQHRIFPSPNNLESTLVDPYYAPRHIVMGAPDVPYDPVTKSILPINPLGKYPDSPNGHFPTEPNNASTRALRKARDTSLINETKQEDKPADNIASSVFRRYLPFFRSIPSESQKKATNRPFKLKPSPTIFLPTPLPSIEQSETENENASQPFGWGHYHALNDRNGLFTPTLRPDVINLLSDNKYIKQKYMRPEQITDIPHVHSPYRSDFMAHQNIQHPSSITKTIQEEFQNVVPLAPSPRITIRAFSYFPGTNKKPSEIWNINSRNWDMDRIDQRMQYPSIYHDSQEEPRKHFYEDYKPNGHVWLKRRQNDEHLLSAILEKMGIIVRPVSSAIRDERLNSNPSFYHRILENRPLHSTNMLEESPDIRILVHPEDKMPQKRHAFENFSTNIDKPNKKFISKFLAQIEKMGIKLPHTVRIRLYSINREHSPNEQPHNEELMSLKEEHPHYLRGKIQLFVRPVENEIEPPHDHRLKLVRVPLSNDYESKVRTNHNLDKMIADILKTFGISGTPFVIRKIRLHKFPSVPSTNTVETIMNDEETNPFDRPSKVEEPFSPDDQLFVPRKPRHIFEYPIEPLLETRNRNQKLFEMSSDSRSDDPLSASLRIIRHLKEPEKDREKISFRFPSKLTADVPFGTEKLETDDRKAGRYIFDTEHVAKTVNDVEQFKNSLLPGIINPKLFDSEGTSSFYRSVRYESGPGDTVTKIVETILPDGQGEKSVYEIPRSKLRDESDVFPIPLTGFRKSAAISPFLSNFLKMLSSGRSRLHNAENDEYKNEAENSITSETKLEGENSIVSRDSLDRKDETPDSSFMGGILDSIIKSFGFPKENYFSRTVRLEKGPGNSFTKITETTTADGQKTVRAETVHDSPNNQSSSTPDGAAMSLLHNLGLNSWPFNSGFGENGVRPEIHRYKFLITPDLKAQLISVKPEGDRPQPGAEDAGNSPSDLNHVPLDSLPVPPMATTPMPDNPLENEETVATGSENPTVGDVKSSQSDEPTLQAASGLAAPPETQVKSDNSTSSLRFYWKILDALSSALCPPYLIRPKSFATETFDKIRRND